MRFNRLHWIAFGISLALMFGWTFTSLGEPAERLFERIGMDGWAWPICGLATFWVSYFALRLAVRVQSRRVSPTRSPTERVG